MFKTSIRYLIVLLCSFVVCTLGVFHSAPEARAGQGSGPIALQAEDTPTATATNATVAISLQGSSGGTVAGHVGTRVQITGNGFPAGARVDIYTTSDTTKCTVDNAGNLQTFNPRSVTVKGNGTFQVNARWPGNSGEPGMSYYICAIQANNVTVSNTAFMVAQDVTVIATTSNVNPGEKITITGSNWFPAQQLAVSITSNQSAGSIVSGQTSSDANGNFTIDLLIPQTTPAGNYGVNVVAINEQSLNTYKDNLITVNASTQATPTAAASPSPTATEATPAPTPTPVANGGSSGTAGGGGIPPLTLLIFTLGGLGTLLVIVGLIMYVSYSRAA